MDFVQDLKNDLIKGYSKSDLEKLIGLPKNSLCSIVKGFKKLSKKSEIKVERWMKSEKPDPLTLHELVFANGAKEGVKVPESFIGLSKGNNLTQNKPQEATETEKQANTSQEENKEAVGAENASQSNSPYTALSWAFKRITTNKIEEAEVIGDNEARISKIKELLLMPAKYLPKHKKNELERELAELQRK